MAHNQRAVERIPTWIAGRVVGPWYVRVALIALIVALSVTQKSGMGAGFIAGSGALLIAATLALPPLWLRLVRLTAGGMAAVSGATLSLQLGFMVTLADGKDTSGLSGALLLALAFASVGAWTADLRLAARDALDQRALQQLQAERHDEVLAQLGAVPTNPDRIRIRDLALLLVAQKLLRR